MTMNLMMISVKKVFISSNSRIICLPCPLPCGRFLIQESAVGGLSYYTKKRRISTTLLSCSEDMEQGDAIQLFVVLFLSADNRCTNGCTAADEQQGNP